ncbi:MAG TPA: hypothetical protein VIH16_07400 [Bellilinea sp.]
MNTPDQIVNQTLRNLSRIAYITGIAFLIISLTLNFIPAKTVNATSGSIWTTRSTCIPPAPQDENHYTWGEEVFIRGSNFDPDTVYHWGITGQPGDASADPGIIVAAWYMAPGTIITSDEDGCFCFKAYTIASDDSGEYSVDVFEVGGTNAKNDNYHVDPAPTATPTNTATNTPTNTEIPASDTTTNTPTSTPTNTPTNTPTSTPTDTPTNTPTNSPTNTPTNTGAPAIDTTNTPEEPANTLVTPAIANLVDLGTATLIPTLPQPAQPGNPPAELIPITGTDQSMPAPLANLQGAFGRLGLALLGIGLVLQGLSKKLED